MKIIKRLSFIMMVVMVSISLTGCKGISGISEIIGKVADVTARIGEGMKGFAEKVEIPEVANVAEKIGDVTIKIANGIKGFGEKFQGSTTATTEISTETTNPVDQVTEKATEDTKVASSGINETAEDANPGE